MWRHDVSAFHKGLWGSWPSPRGGHNGDVIGEASRAPASSTPIPPKVPGGGRPLILGQNLRRAEGQTLQPSLPGPEECGGHLNCHLCSPKPGLYESGENADVDSRGLRWGWECWDSAFRTSAPAATAAAPAGPWFPGDTPGVVSPNSPDGFEKPQPGSGNGLWTCRLRRCWHSLNPEGRILALP